MRTAVAITVVLLCASGRAAQAQAQARPEASPSYDFEGESAEGAMQIDDEPVRLRDRAVVAFRDEAEAELGTIVVAERSKIKSAKASCDRVIAYDADQVNRALLKVKTGLLASLEEDGDLGLRDYVAEVFPTPVAGKPELASCFKPARVAVQQDVQPRVKAAKELVAKMARVTPTLQRIEVISEPSNARFELRPRAGSAPGHHSATNSTLANLRRGIWVLTVRLDGYASIDAQVINLVDSLEPRISCTLAPIESKRASVCSVDNALTPKQGFHGY